MTVPTQGRDQSGVTVERMILDAVNDARADIKDVREDIKGFVTIGAAEAETRRVNGELAHHAQDIADETKARETAVGILQTAQDKTAANVKWGIGIAITIAIAFGTFWIQLGGVG